MKLMKFVLDNRILTKIEMLTRLISKNKDLEWLNINFN